MNPQHTAPISDFSTARLPALPQTLVRLLEECSDNNVELPEVASIVARDATIAAKILNLANSAFLGTRARFLSIEQAVIYLGIDTVRNLAISVSVHESFADISDTEHFKLPEFWYHSLLTALIAKELAELAGYDNPAEAYLAGLLHDIGKCLFCTVSGEAFEKLQLSETPDNDVLDQERQLFGLDHAEAACRLIENWHLAPELAEAIADHHSQEDLSRLPLLGRIVHTANSLAGNGDRAEHSITDKLGVTLAGEALTDLMQQLSEQVSLIGESLGIKVAAAPQNASPARIAAQTVLRTETINMVRLAGMLDNLMRANTMNRILQVLEESLAILFDISKCILLLPDNDTDHYMAAGSFRNKITRPLRETSFQPQQELFLRNCLAATQTRMVRLDHLQPQDTQLSSLFAAFEEELLNISSFPVNSEQRGLLVATPGSIDAASDPSGHTQVITLLLSHVSNRLQLEQLHKQQAKDQVRVHIQAMEEISRSIAHEISNPINVIQNYLTILLNKPDLPDNLAHELNIIDKEIDRISTISEQLHNLSQTPAAPRRVKTDIVSLVQEVVELFRSSLSPEDEIQLYFTGEMSVRPIWSIPDFLQQILMNLLTNSREALAGNGGHITVTLESPNQTRSSRSNEIVIKVCDSGPGLEPAMAEKVFQLGYTSKNGHHSGLGLAIVRKLAHDLGGSVMHQRNERHETQFAVYLPTRSGAAEPGPAQAT